MTTFENFFRPENLVSGKLLEQSYHRRKQIFGAKNIKNLSHFFQPESGSGL